MPKWRHKMHVISNAKIVFWRFWLSTFFLMVENWGVYWEKWAMTWDYGSFCPPLFHSSNMRVQPSSWARCLNFGQTLRLLPHLMWRLVRLHRCAGSPEPSLVAYVISTIISWAGSNCMLTDQVCFLYQALFILMESAKNHVQKIVDRSWALIKLTLDLDV